MTMKAAEIVRHHHHALPRLWLRPYTHQLQRQSTHSLRQLPRHYHLYMLIVQQHLGQLVVTQRIHRRLTHSLRRHTRSRQQHIPSLYPALLEQHHQMMGHAYRQALLQALRRQHRAILLQQRTTAAQQAIPDRLSVQQVQLTPAMAHVYSLVLQQALAQDQAASVLVPPTQAAQAQQATVLVRHTQAARFSVQPAPQMQATEHVRKTLAQAMVLGQLTQVATSRSIAAMLRLAVTQQRRQHRRTLTCLSVSKLPLTHIIENPRLNVGFFMPKNRLNLYVN